MKLSTRIKTAFTLCLLGVKLCSAGHLRHRKLNNLRPLEDDCVIVAVAHSPISIFDHKNVGSINEEEEDFECFIGSQSYPIQFDSPKQKRKMNEMLDRGRIISDRTLLVRHNILIGPAITTDGNVTETKIFLSPGEDSFSLISLDDNDSRRRRSLASTTGDKPILAIRVRDSDNLVHRHSASEMSDKIFGTYDDSVNLKSQMAACSFNQLKITNDYEINIHNLAAPGILEVQIPIPLKTSSSGAIRNAVTKAAEAKLGFPLPGPFEHVMYMLEGCYQDCGYAAYAYINSWLSVYQSDFYSFSGVQMHELGHNLNLGHSGGLDGGTYSDHTCSMGNPLYSDEIGKMCFNPAKNWQIGWYDTRKALIDTRSPDLDHIEKIVGIADYTNNPDQRKVVIKLESGTENDMFVGFNRAIGANSDNNQGANKVTIIKASNDGEGFSRSHLIKILDRGESYIFDGITIAVEGINLTASPATATISISKFTTRSPSNVPSSDPAMLPSTTPTISNSPTISPVPSISQTAVPTKAPTRSPSPSSTPSSEPTFISCDIKKRKLCRSYSHCEWSGAVNKKCRRSGSPGSCASKDTWKRCFRSGCGWERRTRTCHKS